MNTFNQNLIIVGSGLVGMTMALKLSKQKIQSTILEKNSLQILNKISDKRTSAISQGSSRILKEIGIWEKIKKFAQPINEIIVTEGLDENGINFNSKIMNEGPLGYIVENSILKKTVLNELKKSNFIKLIDNTKIKKISYQDDFITISSNKGNFKSSLLIGADGRFSDIRRHANLKYFFKDYNQFALVFNIKHKNPHNEIALERFFPSGPLAILPMKSSKMRYSSVVWTIDKSEKDKVLKNKDFKSLFNKKYNNFFGEIENFTKPKIYSLNIFSCHEYFKKNIVLIGDACQAIHPIAGQGLNLGLRDAAILADSMNESKRLGLQYSDLTILSDYSQKRIIDKNLLVQATHRLNNFFSNDSLLFSKFRNFGLKVFNKSLFLKKQSMLFAMGLKNFNL